MKTYFPGLNGLRFIGAFTVILSHIEFLKSLNGLPNLMEVPFYQNTNGHLGVILFFVLSGFLITYLLLDELKNTSKINIKHFYMRRILRIWPLYYLMILISLFLIPSLYAVLHFSTRVYSMNEMIYYLVFMPNVAKSMGYFIDGAVHLWSIGVEEQFYLMWPFLIVLFRKYTLMLLILVLIGISLLPVGLGYINYNTSFFGSNDLLFNRLESFVIHFKINSMAIGGIIAYIVHKQKTWLNWIKSDFVEVVIFIGTFVLWFSGIILTSFSDEVYSILFSLIIFNCATKEKPIVNLENKLFNFLGKISYGLYVYHWLIILTIVHLLKSITNDYVDNFLWMNLVLYVGTIALTILISHLSFTYFEKPFLRLKNKFN